MCLESKDSIVAKCPEIYFVKKSQYAIVSKFSKPNSTSSLMPWLHKSF